MPDLVDDRVVQMRPEVRWGVKAQSATGGQLSHLHDAVQSDREANHVLAKHQVHRYRMQFCLLDRRILGGMSGFHEGNVLVFLCLPRKSDEKILVRDAF